MRSKFVPGGRVAEHVAHPERTATRETRDFGTVEIREWPNRPSMARSIRMQESRAPRMDDWRAYVKLGPVEGY